MITTHRLIGGHLQERRVPFPTLIYLLTLVLVLGAPSKQQSETVLSPSADPFYLDLEHKLGSNEHFKHRATILVRPKTDYRAGQASFTHQQGSLTESDLKILLESSAKGDTYFLRATLRKKKADQQERPPRVTQTIVKACSLASSNLADTLVVNLSPSNEFLSVNTFTTDPECDGELPLDLPSKFNTSIQLDLGSLGPQPDTVTYIKRLEEERQSKQREGKEDNRSFLAKYWIYIVPAVIILMMMGGPEQGAR